jgi:hypothetical protein
MFGPVTITQPFLTRRNPTDADTMAAPNGSFHAHAEFAGVGLTPGKSITLATGLSVPSASSLILAVFDVTFTTLTRVFSLPIFAPSFSTAEVDVDLFMFRSGAGSPAIAPAHTVVSSHFVVAGSVNDARAARRQRFMILRSMSPAVAPGEVMQFFLVASARAGGFGLASGAADIAGTLNSIVVAGA